MAEVVDALKAAIANHAVWNNQEVGDQVTAVLNKLDDDLETAGYEPSSDVEAEVKALNEEMDTVEGGESEEGEGEGGDA